MARASVTVEGLDKLTADLSRKADQVLVAVAEAVEGEAEAVKGDMQSSVSYDTGTLHDSIVAEIHPDGRNADVIVGEHYGTYVEHGTSKMPAQPFALPAAEQGRTRFPDRVRETVKRALG